MQPVTDPKMDHAACDQPKYGIVLPVTDEIDRGFNLQLSEMGGSTCYGILHFGYENFGAKKSARFLAAFGYFSGEPKFG